MRRLNAPCSDQGAFSNLAGRRKPLGMHSGAASYSLLRETYFDTTDGHLADQGMRLRLRSEARGHQTLELVITEGVNLQGVMEVQSFETPVIGGGVYATLASDSEVSTRVRALVDPDALRPRAAVDIDREARELKPGRFARVTHRIVFDDVIAHAPGATREFQEVTLEEIGSGAVALEELAGRLQNEPGFAADGRLDTYARIQSALEGHRGAQKPEVPHDVRVAVMILRDWEVGLVEGPDGYRLPTARGSGEELAAEYLAELGAVETEPELDLVGFAVARRGGSDLEVWLHRHVGSDPPPGLVWIPLLELMQRMGGPRLRDPGLISTMLMLVRSETGQRLLDDAPNRPGPPRRLSLEPRDPDAKTGKASDDFLDLELSILDFNQRVLELAEDERVPLLERFRFLSIFSSNMDEFFVVRVGRLKDEVAGVRSAEYEDLSPEQLLDLIAVRVRALMARQYQCLNTHLLPALAERGVRLLRWTDLDAAQQEALGAHFQSELFPLLTPLSLQTGPGRSFPRLVSLGLALAVSLRRGEGRQELGYVPLPDDATRFLPVPGTRDLIALEEVVGAQVGSLFAGAEIDGVYAFRATRLADVALDEDNRGSLLAQVADGVEARPFMPVIRLEIGAAMPRDVRAYLLKTIRDDQPVDSATLTRSDLYQATGPVDLRGVAELHDLDVEGGTYPEYRPEAPLPADRPLFDLLGERDVLVHLPFQTFENSVGRFLEEAATDPDVVAVKLTLYRTGRRSPVVDALLAALDGGKDVSVFVELTARFDEESNIQWTRRLEEAGARVVYGVPGYKTHAKTALVVRRENGGVRRYVHVGTGNYNASTARFYTDLGLMSADPDLGADLNDFFNELTGGVGPPSRDFRRLLVAPHSLVRGIERMIDREVEHARAGRPARIRAKLNGLADRKIVKRLYDAAGEGVQVDLIVRSICTLRPDVPGLSERIRVCSILGRFLEHSRIYHFENAGQSEYYIGSADWRARNLRRRVEVVAPIDDAEARTALDGIFQAQLADPRAWVLRADGAWERRNGEGPDAQTQFMRSGGVPGR